MPRPLIHRASIGLVAVATLALAGCATAEEASSSPDSIGDVPDNYQLADVCPATVTIQMDWKPQVEYGTAFQLIGSDYEIDANAKSISGPLTVDGYDTGVDVEVRNNIMGQSVAATMATDSSIFLGFMNTDSQISAVSNGMEYTAVVAPLKHSPQIMMWDPEAYPGAETILDIAEAGATLVVQNGAIYAPMLIELGVPENAFDYSYTGSPARFVSEGDIGQQGFATAEPYQYEHEIDAWGGRPVAYQMLKDIGYNPYSQSYVVRTADVEDSSACLERLVPIIQKAAADFHADGSWATDLVVEAVDAYNEDWIYSEGQGEYAWEMMRELGLIGDESGMAGGIDLDRVQDVIDNIGPILASSGVDVPDDLTADRLATTQFLDASISSE